MCPANREDDDFQADRNGKDSFGEDGTKSNNISPVITISIITLIGLVCVIIDYYLEKE